jgi:hypothetical protein
VKTLILASVLGALVGAVPVHAQAEPEVRQPSLKEPGPDTPDFPDSAYTVAPGVTYVESAMVRTLGKPVPRTRLITVPTLVRHGVSKGWELRLSGDLLIDEDVASTGRTGVGDATLGFKHTLHDEEKGRRPGMGTVVQVTLPTASAGFSTGHVEGFASLNFDHTLSDKFEFEWNAGVSLLTNDAGSQFLQPIFLAVLGYEVSDRFAVFADGFVATPSQPGLPDELVVGAGATYLVHDRLAFDASYHAGLTSVSPDHFFRLGSQIAF